MFGSNILDIRSLEDMRDCKSDNALTIIAHEKSSAQTPIYIINEDESVKSNKREFICEDYESVGNYDIIHI